MSKDLEHELRDALRPVDPGDDFARKVMAQLPSQVVTLRPRANVVTRTLPWLPAALAASLLVVIFAKHERQEQYEIEAGLRARQQVMEALKVTSEKLDLAYQIVNNQSHPETDADTGV